MNGQVRPKCMIKRVTKRCSVVDIELVFGQLGFLNRNFKLKQYFSTESRRSMPEQAQFNRIVK